MFYVVSDNYDDGQEVEEYQTLQELVSALVQRQENGDTLDRVECVIEGQEIPLPADAIAAESQRRHDIKYHRKEVKRD